MLPRFFIQQSCRISRSVFTIYCRECYVNPKYSTNLIRNLQSLPLSSYTVEAKRFFSDENRTEYVCLKCNKTINVSNFKCPHCNYLQIPSVKQTYFQLFDENRDYNINEEKLKQKFRDLQAEYHPDKFATKGERERHVSEEISSLINKAYTTLNNPYKRGVYLLKLNGIEMSDSDTQLDKMFLMEVMELNEELEDIKDRNKLTEYEIQNESRINKISNDVAQAFMSEQFEKAKLELQRMKYFVSIKNRIQELKPKL